jgi:phage I-like protein
MAALSNDPATTEMANLGAPSEQMIADFTDDIKTLATMLKLLEVHDCDKSKRTFPKQVSQ